MIDADLCTIDTCASYKSQAAILHEVVGQTFPQLVTIGTQALATYPAGATEQSSHLLHLILKTYSSSITVSLSRHQQSHDSLVPWGRLLFQMVNTQLPKEAVPEDEEARERCEWWKAKKWSFKILCGLFHRYVMLSIAPYSLSICGVFLIIYIFFDQIRKPVTNAVNAQDRLHPIRGTLCYPIRTRNLQSILAPSRVVHLRPSLALPKMSIQHLLLLQRLVRVWFTSFPLAYNKVWFMTPHTFSVKPKSTWTLLKPHFLNLVSHFIAPQLYFTPAKQEVWDSDPLEFVRAHIGMLCCCSLVLSAG